MKEFFKYMLATVCGLFLFIFFYVLMMISMLVGLLAMSEPSETVVKEHSVYVLEMNGTVSERSDDDAVERALLEAMGRSTDATYGLNDILANIEKAKDNPNIDGIYLKGGSLACGYTTAEEIRDALVRFKDSGKFVVAYADSYTQKNYYIASAADHVYINRSGSLAWQGLGATLEFYTGLLEKLGVEMQVVKVGTFKSAVEPYFRKDMSEANRLQYNVMLADMWAQIRSDVAASRKMDEDSLNSLADLCMMLQPQELYVSSGMVDSLCYQQDMEDVLTNLVGTDEWHLLSHSDMVGIAQKNNNSENIVAVLYAEGDITDESGDGIVGKDMVKEINKLREDDDVKAVVLRVNSPGGSAYASEQIHHALKLLQEEKPLIVSMGDYAASGGYYISCLGDYIYAEPTTLTGSIGIFGLIPNLGGLAEKVGLSFDTIGTNVHSNINSTMTLMGMNNEEQMLMQAEINRGYELFTLRCAEGRNLSQDSIKAIGEGRVWTGVRASNIGLVDALGNLNDAIIKATEMAELADYKLVEYPEIEDEMTKLLNAFSSSVRMDKQLEVELGRETYQTLMLLRGLSKEPSVQARMPYVLKIN